MLSGIRLRLVTAALVLLTTPGVTSAAVVASRNSNGEATVLGSLSVLKKSDLDFGELAVAGAGTAVIDPLSGTLTTTGGLTVLGSSAHPAIFTGTGSRNSVVNIRLPKSPIILTRVGGTETMTVSNWTLDGKTNRKIPSTQAFDFAVGGTLNVAAGQAEGDYLGTFTVTVQYP